MSLQRFLQLICTSLLLGIFCGCAKKETQPTTFLLPWMQPNGTYELTEVTLMTLKTPHEMSGTAAQVWVAPQLTTSGFGGPIARPRLTKSGNVYIPIDAQSSLAVVMYAQLERLLLFEQKLGTAQHLKWPRRAAVELPVPGQTGSATNNAHYFPTLDVIGILPFSISTGVPLSLNHGIVAHEHFHAHFQAAVLAPLQKSIPTRNPSLDWLLDHQHLGTTVMATDFIFNSAGGMPYDISILNEVVLRAWNEGLADLFASNYTGQADFFTPSLPEQKGKRALTEALSPLASAADLRARALEVPTYRFGELLGFAYQQGTALAKLLYRIKKHEAIDSIAFQRFITERLRTRVLPLAAANYRDNIMDFDAIVPVLLEELQLTRQSCDALEAVVTKNVYVKNFAGCSL